jgi:hypothetical protein
MTSSFFGHRVLNGLCFRITNSMVHIWYKLATSMVYEIQKLYTTEPFGCADKPTEKHCWLIYYERKILFRLKKQAEKDGL